MSRVRTFAITALCACGLLAATAGSASATFVMNPQIDFATDPIAVGSSGTGTISFSNDSGTEVGEIERIVLEPSCRLPGQTPPCTNREPGIFSIGGGTGVNGTSCQGLSFNVTSGAMPFVGSLEFGPPTAISSMFAGDICAITFTYTALAVPTFDTQGEPGVQTDQLAEVRAEHNGGGPQPFGPGTGDTTVTPKPATPTPTPPAAAPTAKKCKKKKKGKSAAAAKKCKKKRK